MNGMSWYLGAGLSLGIALGVIGLALRGALSHHGTAYCAAAPDASG